MITVYSPANRSNAAISNNVTIKATCDYCGNTILDHSYWFTPQNEAKLDPNSRADYKFFHDIVHLDESLLRYEVEEYLREQGNYINTKNKIKCKFCFQMSRKIANYPNKVK